MPINLFDYQIEHVSKIQVTLESVDFCLDFSILGSGKTYTALTVAKDYDFCLIVAPKSVHSKWKTVSELVPDFPENQIISFAKMRNKNNNEFLFIKKMQDTEIILITDYFKQLSKSKKVIVIIDEIQNLKNNTLQFRSARTLLSGNTKFLGLSGSPIDKQEQASRVLSLCGVFTEQLAKFDIGTKTFDFSGLLQIKRFLRDNTVISESNYKSYPYLMFQSKFKEYIFEMKCPEFKTTVDVKNGLYNFYENTIVCGMWVDRLNHLVTHRNKDNPMETLSQISKVMQSLERTKLKTFIRLAKKQLSETPNKKVVLLFNYIHSIKFVEEALKEFNPLVIYGATKGIDRTENLRKFQENSSQFRLLVGNLEILSTGVDLDDKSSEFPRICYCNANFNAITLYQLVHRFKRIDTLSNSTIRFVYCNSVDLEIKIINALTRKSKVMKETTIEQVKHNTIFPGDLSFDSEKLPEFYNQIPVTCGICLEDFNSDKFELKCKHFFHADCISVWFQTTKKRNCPYCKQRV